MIWWISDNFRPRITVLLIHFLLIAAALAVSLLPIVYLIVHSASYNLSV